MENDNAGNSGETEQDTVDEVLAEEDVEAPTEGGKSRHKRSAVDGGHKCPVGFTRIGPVCVPDK